MKKTSQKKYITAVIILLTSFFLVGGIVFFVHKQNKKEVEIQAKNLEVEKHELATLKTEISQLKEQEQELKKKFVDCQTLSEKGIVKEKLTALQNTLFNKKESLKNLAPASASSALKDKKKLDKKRLAASLKMELKKQIEDLISGTYKEDYSIQSDPSFKFLFARHYLDEKDCQEIKVLIEQVQGLREAKEKSEESERDKKLENNPKLFYFSTKMSTERNGNWKHYHGFHGKHKGWNYEVYVPDNHPALNNVLFNDGWGTNSEIKNLYSIEGIEEPTELQYWNVEKQKNEIIPEKEIIQATQEGKRLFYEKFVNLEDNITINYFQEIERERERELTF